MEISVLVSPLPQYVIHYERTTTIILHRIGFYPYRSPREIFFYSRDCEVSSDLLVKS